MLHITGTKYARILTYFVPGPVRCVLLLCMQCACVARLGIELCVVLACFVVLCAGGVEALFRADVRFGVVLCRRAALQHCVQVVALVGFSCYLSCISV